MSRGRRALLLERMVLAATLFSFNFRPGVWHGPLPSPCLRFVKTDNTHVVQTDQSTPLQTICTAPQGGSNSLIDQAEAEQ